MYFCVFEHKELSGVSAHQGRLFPFLTRMAQEAGEPWEANPGLACLAQCHIAFPWDTGELAEREASTATAAFLDIAI